MNKKILMSGIAALLIGGSMHATSVSASAISVDWSGEATLSATFSDTCAVAASDLTADASATVTGAFADFLGISYTPDDDVSGGTNADQIEDGLDAINGFTNVLPADLSMTGAISFLPNPCGTTNPSADNPVWKTSSEYLWSASGTLANGLTVSVGDAAADGVAVTLAGAFGSVSFEKGGDSAVKAANVGGDGDIDVAGFGFGGHALSTSGTAGYVVNYQAPSVGGLDLYISYAPSSNDSAVNDDAYMDTLAFGATMAAGDISLSVGYETASANANASTANSNACDHGAITLTGAENFTSSALIDDVYGTDECGDQTLMMIGASMSAANVGINAAYSNLDTEEADRATTSIDLSTSAGDWNLGLGYTTVTRSAKIAGADTTQTAIGGSIGTSLGDGVDFSIALSNNEYDSSAESTARGGNGATSDFQAIAELVITY